MDRRFSINSIALGNIRRRRGRYLLLIAGIGLAIYFVAAALLFRRHHVHLAAGAALQPPGRAGCDHLQLRERRWRSLSLAASLLNTVWPRSWAASPRRGE
ncbi:MAG: hypothetical protein ACOX30_09215 [Dethiobacteria bacterium]